MIIVSENRFSGKTYLYTIASRKIKKDTTGFLDDGNSDVFGMDEDSNISKPDKKESDSRSNILFLKHACDILISQTQFSVGQTAEPNLFHHGESSYRVV